ncbi:hypothetical protein HY768_00930 [candidate division TA06 bacterium]|uniref:Uncharacterized protein n=1 Tax=candidate division TA06 bacterium TaxID=2250710 RepID=A0A933I710_UNCT6|nr:hypothetical protein [candidate division TA06 bacterium]
MAYLTYAQQSAFAHIVVQLMKDNQTQLKEAGFDAAKKIASLETFVKQAVEDDVRQEQLKSELAKATDKAVKSLDTTYKQASSLVDAMVGVIGKDTPLAKRMRQLRDQMQLEARRGKRQPK